MTDNTDGWSLESLLALLSRDPQSVRLDRLRRLGVLDEHDQVTAAAKNWGSLLSHTAVEDDDELEGPAADHADP